MEPGDLAVVGIGIHCAASVRNSAFRLSLPDKAGIAADDQLLPGAFPGSSSIPDAASMAGFRMVSGSVGIFRRGFRGSSGPYIQWKTLQLHQSREVIAIYVRSVRHPAVSHFAGLMELLIPIGLAMLAVPGVRRQQMPLMALLAA